MPYFRHFWASTPIAPSQPTPDNKNPNFSLTVRSIFMYVTVAVLCVPVLVILTWAVGNFIVPAFALIADLNALLFTLILPVVACVLAVCVIVLTNPMHALLSLVGIFLSAVLFYVSSGIEFIGLVFLIVYVGAVAILFLFVIMLLNVKSLTSNERLITRPAQTVSLVFGVLLGCHLFVSVADQLGRTTLQSTLARSHVEQTSIDEQIYYRVMYREADVNAIASLYDAHAPLFWITTLNLLVSLVGAIILATSTTEQTIKVTPTLVSASNRASRNCCATYTPSSTVDITVDPTTCCNPRCIWFCAIPLVDTLTPPALFMLTLLNFVPAPVTCLLYFSANKSCQLEMGSERPSAAGLVAFNLEQSKSIAFIPVHAWTTKSSRHTDFDCSRAHNGLAFFSAVIVMLLLYICAPTAKAAGKIVALTCDLISALGIPFSGRKLTRPFVRLLRAASAESTSFLLLLFTFPGSQTQAYIVTVLMLLIWLCGAIYWTETRPADRPPGSGIRQDFAPFSKVRKIRYLDGSSREVPRSAPTPIMSPIMEKAKAYQSEHWGWPSLPDDEVRSQPTKVEDVIILPSPPHRVAEIIALPAVPESDRVIALPAVPESNKVGIAATVGADTLTAPTLSSKVAPSAE